METFLSKSGEGMWLKIMKKMELICVIIAFVFSSILVIYCLFVYEATGAFVQLLKRSLTGKFSELAFSHYLQSEQSIILMVICCAV